MPEQQKRPEPEFRASAVRLGGLEPPTPTLSVWCSNRLSYKRRRQLEGGSPYQQARETLPGRCPGHQNEETPSTREDAARMLDAQRRMQDGVATYAQLTAAA